MKIIQDNHQPRLSMTIREAYQIGNLLYTLESMCGTFDEYFNAECDLSGKYRKEIEKKLKIKY